jgi:hypothetical protein
MSVNFPEVREQVRLVGEIAPAREQQLKALRSRAQQLLRINAHELETLRRKVEYVYETYDPHLRCALPVREALDSHFQLPMANLSAQATLLAADGSQIAPDRHAEIHYSLINVGAIQMRLGVAKPPVTHVESELLYDDKLYTTTGTISEGQIALMRDLNERSMLLHLAKDAVPPVISFTDGPMELWGAHEAETAADYRQSLKKYLSVLSQLHELGVVTAGYVDKPAANLVVRLLEIASLEEPVLQDIKKNLPLRGVTDIDLYRHLLAPGERSAVYAIQSKSAQEYGGVLALHFFYLNVGRSSHPWLARVEIPGWVAENTESLDALHTVLYKQCQVMGSRPYPYLLHRAHETAVVSLEEHEQVSAMLMLELRRRGVEVGDMSHKQSAKNMSGRTSYQRGM